MTNNISYVLIKQFFLFETGKIGCLELMNIAEKDILLICLWYKWFSTQKLLWYTVCINFNLKLNINIYYCIHYTPFNEKGIWKNLNIHEIITNLINKVSTRLNFNDNDFHFVHLSVSRLNIKISPVLSFSAEIMDREIPTGGDIKFPPKYGVNGNTYMIKNLT